MGYLIEYSPEAREHWDALSRREQAIIIDGVETQLTHEPTKVTRNRKQMRPNPLAARVLRIGNFRVYYDVQSAVFIRAVGVKVGNKIFVGGEELVL